MNWNRVVAVVFFCEAFLDTFGAVKLLSKNWDVVWLPNLSPEVKHKRSEVMRKIFWNVALAVFLWINLLKF